MTESADSLTAPSDQRTSAVSVWKELFRIDLRSLAAFRIGLAIAVLIDLIGRYSDLHAFYTDEGVMPRWALQWSGYDSFLSLCRLSGSMQWQIVVFVLGILCSLSMLVGLWSRLATFGTWLVLISFHARNILALNSGDTLLGLLLFWGMFLPLGAQYSIDARRRGHFADQPKFTYSLASIALMVQVLLVYVVAAMLKMNSVQWLDGTVLTNSLKQDYIVTATGKRLLAFPSLLEMMTYLVVGAELLMGVLPFVPVFNGILRILVVTAVISMHVGFAICLEVGIFPYASIAAILIFLPPEFWEFFRRPTRDMEETSSSTVQHSFFTERNVYLAWAEQAIVASCFVWVVLFNVSQFMSKQTLPRRILDVGSLLHLRQYWGVFQVKDLETGWFIIVGHCKNGRDVDLWRGTNPISWDKPPLVSADYRDHRWGKYMMIMALESQQRFRPPLAAYLAREWNRKAAPDEQVEAVRIYYKIDHVYGPEQMTLPVDALLLCRWTAAEYEWEHKTK